jgi:hypothetical protein
MKLLVNIGGIKRNHPDRSCSGRSAVPLTFPAVQSGASLETARPVPNAVRDGSNSVGGIGLEPTTFAMSTQRSNQLS